MDTPMRTVKTMLHTMAKSRGDAILDNLTKVTDPSGSELVPYLKKLLNSGVGGKENQNNGGHQTGGPGSGTTGIPSLPNNNNINSGQSKMPRFSKSDHDQLAEIFRKIGECQLPIFIYLFFFLAGKSIKSIYSLMQVIKSRRSRVCRS